MNPNLWKPPPFRPIVLLSWCAIAAIFLLVLLLLNLGHEASHWFLWKRSNIPSCVYFNVTNPVVGLRLESRFLLGLFGGPLFNLTAGFFLLIPYWRFHSIRGFLIWVITYALLIRPVVVLNHWLFLGSGATPPDEIFLHRILSAAHGELAASLVIAGTLALTLSGMFLLWIGSVRRNTNGQGILPYILTVGLAVPLVLPVAIMGLLVLIILSTVGNTPLFGVCP